MTERITTNIEGNLYMSVFEHVHVPMLSIQQNYSNMKCKKKRNKIFYILYFIDELLGHFSD
jgi:hypothetical protein